MDDTALQMKAYTVSFTAIIYKPFLFIHYTLKKGLFKCGYIRRTTLLLNVAQIKIYFSNFINNNVLKMST